jgi:hypothetical protein
MASKVFGSCELDVHVKVMKQRGHQGLTEFMAHQSYNISNFYHPLIKTHRIKTIHTSLYLFNFDIIEFIMLILFFDEFTICNKKILF